MPPSRYIRLTEEEDARLREIEQDLFLKAKVRLQSAPPKCAQVLPLSNRGSNMRKIAFYTGRSPASIARDFDRWSERGFEGLADGTASGNPPRITTQMEAFMEEKLSEEKEEGEEEERTWNATQLAEVLKEEFELEVTSEAVRQHLVCMGYSWKRTRYVPNKAPDPEAASEPHRGSVAKTQRFPDAASVLRFGGRVEGSRPARFAAAGSRGDSMFTWRYLVV